MYGNDCTGTLQRGGRRSPAGSPAPPVMAPACLAGGGGTPFGDRRPHEAAPRWRCASRTVVRAVHPPGAAGMGPPGGGASRCGSGAGSWSGLGNGATPRALPANTAGFPDARDRRAVAVRHSPEYRPSRGAGNPARSAGEAERGRGISDRWSAKRRNVRPALPPWRKPGPRTSPTFGRIAYRGEPPPRASSHNDRLREPAARGAGWLSPCGRAGGGSRRGGEARGAGRGRNSCGSPDGT